MKPFILVQRQAELHALIRELAKAEHIAVDTESNSFYAYFERVCLLQISTREEDYIVDPLNLDDLAPLGEILANPDIEKIFHAASNDVLGLKRDFRFRICNLFDTAVACKLLGCKQLGLARILESEFGAGLNKKWQRCDWGKRPLKEEQLDYARLDTHYLIALRDRLAAGLQSAQLWDAAREAFARASEQEWQEKPFRPANCLQLHGARSLGPVGKSVLKALYIYREQEAKHRNRAPFRILSNETLVRLARCRPADLEEFAKTKGLPRNYRKGRGAQRLLELIHQAEQSVESAPAPACKDLESV